MIRADRVRHATKSWLLLLLVLLLGACVPNQREIREAQAAAEARQPTDLSCSRADRCAIQSPLRDLATQALAASSEASPQHYVLLLESGHDALLARINLLRAARESIEIQSYIFAEDDAGYFVLNELLQAARRGVRVRVLLDQLFSVDDIKLLAKLAQAHVNFELRLYNPTFGEAHTQPIEFVAGILCCFFRFNQRMHNKLLMIDGMAGITGGRNFQNRYFDWDPVFNYRDRDILVAGPEAGRMQASFEAFWRHRKSIPIAALRDVRQWIGRDADAIGPLPAPKLTRADLILDMSAQADNAAVVQRRLARHALPASRVDYVSDQPGKRFERDMQARRDLTGNLQMLVRGAQRRVLLQTPYLVMSRNARELFRDLQDRPDPPVITVSTNSLASTDALPVYALSHKYKRRYLREFGFNIHEYKPFPASAPIDLPTDANGDSLPLGAFATESAHRLGSGSGRMRGPLPLERAGVRVGLHAKSMVIDDSIAMVGTHNFDPRSDKLNTESAVVIYDQAVAARLADSILHDTLPENAWTIARRPRPPILSGVNYSLGKLFEALPLFDFWPFRYATSYEIKPGCEPVARGDPGFSACYEPVGDFPQVELPMKSIYTRILTAFGAGLAPIL